MIGKWDPTFLSSFDVLDTYIRHIEAQTFFYIQLFFGTPNINISNETLWEGLVGCRVV